MKKLIVIATFVLSSTLVSAATYNWAWSASNLCSYGGTTTADRISGIDVSLWLVGASEDICVSTVESSTTGSIALGNATFTTSDILTALNTDYTFYLTYTDANGNMFSSKGIKEVTTQVDAVSGKNIAFNNMATITKGTSGWTAANVPEPTSGLLLLCGLAGLALRRKRA